MKKIIIAGFMLSIVSVSAQISVVPKGWDAVMLNGKPGYMNLVTGEIVSERPIKQAEKPTVKVELDPAVTYKVKKGETLYGIASKNNLTVDDLYKLNSSLATEGLKEGVDLVIGVDKSKEGVVVEKVVEDMYTNPSNNSQHFVKKGETLYSIAKMHGLSVDKIKKLNNLPSNAISVGQKLILKK